MKFSQFSGELHSIQSAAVCSVHPGIAYTVVSVGIPWLFLGDSYHDNRPLFNR